LYGVGVGPGDPELLTLKAQRILSSVDRIYAAKSSTRAYSTALSIIEPCLGDGARVETLDFPMTKDKAELETAWRRNCQRLVQDLELGLDLAFVTLGDPMTYSTFGYLLQTMAELAPDAPIEIVPAVTSYHAAAAASKTILAEQEQCVAIVSGAMDVDKIKAAAAFADTVVVLKAYKKFERIRETLRELRMHEAAVLMTDCGLEGERMVRDLDEIKEQPGYFTLILAKKAPASDE
jgi:precorrin-2/cobalt-factor-2 C20-methyltransferase